MPKLREEISSEYKWDLSAIYKDTKEFEEEIQILKKTMEELKNYNENIMESADKLYEFLELENMLSRKISKAYTYAHLNFDADTSNATSQDMLGKVENLSQKFSELVSFVNPVLLKHDYRQIEKFYEENPKLKEYEIGLKEIFRYKEHTLSSEEEMLISNMEKTFTSSSKTYEALTDTDLTHGTITDEQGERQELTDSNFIKYLKSTDRRVRKEAFQTLYKTYKQYQNTICSCLKGDIEASTTVSKIRKYNSAMEASLFNDNVNTDVYNNLINTVSDNLQALYNYYALKKDILGLDEMHLYDTYVSIVNEKPKEYTFEEAKDLVIDTLDIFGEPYITDLKKAFSEKWIDVYNNKGKRGGAYSGGSYDTYPYVLLNFEGTLNDVSTLAHELGHSMHSFYSRKNQSYQNSDYEIFVAEVASTVNELLLAKNMLKKATSKSEKLIILNNLLDLFKSTIYRQTMFAEFEKDIYAMHENGEILTSKVLCDHYYKLNEKYFGPNVVIDDEIRYEWERIPHFYYNFYVYKYATGLSAACYIVNSILEGKENAKENYLKFLSLGGSMDPLDELKVAGVDMTKPEVVLSAIKMFEDILEEFKETYNS